MMTQMGPSNNAVLRKTAAISLFLLLGITFAFSQENESINKTSAIKNGWWNPIFKKHKIDLEKFNYINTFDIGMNDTINNLCLEMGNSDSLNIRKIPYKDAILISKGAGQTYWIITSEFARHDLDNNILVLTNGLMSYYDFNSKDVIPSDTSSFLEMYIDIKINRIEATSKE
jgi:hypothetical protein